MCGSVCRRNPPNTPYYNKLRHASVAEEKPQPGSSTCYCLPAPTYYARHRHIRPERCAANALPSVKQNEPPIVKKAAEKHRRFIRSPKLHAPPAKLKIRLEASAAA
eukprot:GHVU01068576.1.p5 GENE.GHVU01068576.1~~GHVU01068576.1.p5  ORF type:complete len:106 (+),score=6.95 GHVU01068576.1:2442-2759(+)